MVRYRERPAPDRSGRLRVGDTARLSKSCPAAAYGRRRTGRVSARCRRLHVFVQSLQCAFVRVCARRAARVCILFYRRCVRVCASVLWPCVCVRACVHLLSLPYVPSALYRKQNYRFFFNRAPKRTATETENNNKSHHDCPRCIPLSTSSSSSSSLRFTRYRPVRTAVLFRD